MNILVIGGTRYFGIHMVNALLKAGHKVTIATRGQSLDPFFNQVDRILCDRTNKESLCSALSNKNYDIILDNICYSPNDLTMLLEIIQPKRYILTSSCSVYHNFRLNMTEDEYNPLSHPLKEGKRSDFSYDEGKRQAEAALYQRFSQIPSAAARFPFVIGEDDYTNRLYFYVKQTVLELPMQIDNLDSELSFIDSKEAGDFLAWLAESNLTGPVNAASQGTISLKKILNYVERKTNRKPLLSASGELSPYQSVPSYYQNTQKANADGFTFSKLDDWIYSLLDAYIKRATDEL